MARAVEVFRANGTRMAQMTEDEVARSEERRRERAEMMQDLQRSFGAVVDAAIVDGSAHMLALLMSMAPGGMLREARGQSLLDGPHWSRSYVCADGGFIAVQCLEAKFYGEFLRLMDLADDPDFARQYEPALWPALTQRLAALFGTRPRDDWAALFAGSDACVAPVLSPREAAADAHMAARGIWGEAGGMLQPAPAPRFDGVARALAAVPGRDQHRAEILAELGLNSG